MKNVFSGDDEILRFVYIGAVRDAVRQRSYAGRKKWLEEDAAFEAVKEPLKRLAEKVLAGKTTSQEDYGRDFLRTAEAVCEGLGRCPGRGTEPAFQFGHAQKLVNITMKYFYITAYGDEEAKVRFRYCHCPMDQRLLTVAWDERERLGIAARRSAYLAGWGNMDFDRSGGEIRLPARYLSFQRDIRALAQAQGMTPLAYDYCHWPRAEGGRPPEGR